MRIRRQYTVHRITRSNTCNLAQNIYKSYTWHLQYISIGLCIRLHMVSLHTRPFWAYIGSDKIRTVEIFIKLSLVWVHLFHIQYHAFIGHLNRGSRKTKIEKFYNIHETMQVLSEVLWGMLLDFSQNSNRDIS